jgi:hypothetical protein
MAPTSFSQSHIFTILCTGFRLKSVVQDVNRTALLKTLHENPDIFRFVRFNLRPNEMRSMEEEHPIMSPPPIDRINLIKSGIWSDKNHLIRKSYYDCFVTNVEVGTTLVLWSGLCGEKKNVIARTEGPSIMGPSIMSNSTVYHLPQEDFSRCASITLL